MKKNLVTICCLTIMIVIIFGALLLTEEGMGVVFDEYPYYRSSQRHIGWYDHLVSHIYLGDYSSSFKKHVIDRYFGMKDKHPPLVKYYYAFVTKLFEGYIDYVRSVRIGVMILFCGLCLRLFLFV